ncbi:uncharacterized protein LOC132098516 [Carassius carassius]|uniref:uncharacterized protein LOC132098516 n=1 Tax=Carassius carassius TaxID=217509 RepID=UPI002868BC6B|nr:uncharacterized protein LOC132098516 [Carassius carassius]
MAHRELDKLARNIPTFKPDPAGGHDVHASLQDIDFHLQTVINVTDVNTLYLLKITSRHDVHCCPDRQPETVKAYYQQLLQTLILEFSDPDSDHGLLIAMDLKQGRLENPQTFCSQLRKAYFGACNEPGMEQDVNLKTLFLRNLHASWSFHLRVPACLRNMTTQELRNSAHKACTKQKTICEKTVKNPKVSVSEHCLELSLDGALQHHSHRHFYRESIPFQASRGQHNHATSETAEILRMLKELLYMKTRKEDKEDEPDILCLSIRTETNTLSNCHLYEPTTLTYGQHDPATHGFKY